MSAGEPPEAEPPDSGEARACEPQGARGAAAERPSSEPSPNGPAVLELLDGAAPDPGLLALGDEIERQRRVAADVSQPLDARVQAFEDIVDLEVGDTNLVRARNVERETGLRQLFLKFEGGNPTGTQKDRIAFTLAHDALRRGFDAITLATCGNYGAAMALAAQLAGLRCVIHVPEGYRTRRLDEMGARGAEILRDPGDYEAAVARSRDQAEADGLYDANPGGANTALQLWAYAEIAHEIYDELRDAPTLVAVPVSNGTTLAGIYKGFASLYRRGKTSRIPRIVAGSSSGKNPIVRAFLKGLPACEDLDPRRVRETAVNEPLVNWHSFDGDLALEAIRRTEGWGADASDKEMLSWGRLLRAREGLEVLPAATAGLSVLVERHRAEPLRGDRYVAVVTGRKG